MHIFDLFKSIIFNNEKNMKFNVKTDDLHKVKTELLIIPLPLLKYADNKFLELDKLCNHFLSKIARENQIDGNIGANILLHSDRKRPGSLNFISRSLEKTEIVTYLNLKKL